MTVISLLASQLGERGNDANIRLAKEIAVSENRAAIKELVANLGNKDKNIQSDCIKTLYETGYLNPALIAGYYADFLALLKSKNNRLVWGGMIALATITDLKPEEIFASLSIITETISKGSVITIDNGIEILARLNKYEKYFDTTDPLLAEQLWACPIKQLPQYIEKALQSINSGNKEIYITIIEKRKPECESDSQSGRLAKALKQIIKR